MSRTDRVANRSLPQRVLATTKGCVNSLIVGFNTLVVFSLMVPFALLKAALRVAPARLAYTSRKRNTRWGSPQARRKV